VQLFLGQVEAYDADVIEAPGHSYVRDIMSSP
jgi:hypothetical protein